MKHHSTKVKRCVNDHFFVELKIIWDNVFVKLVPRRKEDEARELAQKNKRFALVESDPEEDLNIKPKKKKKKKKEKDKNEVKSESEDEFDRMENERWQS